MNAKVTSHISVPVVSPRVSVITIFLNAVEYLDQAIESVLAQTLTDWELILVDDGSTDGSTDIALKWQAAQSDRIRYVDHEGHANKGMSASRNRGLLEARGRYVALLDADDVYLPDRLAAHVAILERLPQIDMVQSDQLYWYQWRTRRGRSGEMVVSRPPVFLGDGIFLPPHGLLSLLGVPQGFVGSCSITIRRTAAMELGGWDEAFKGLYEDQVFMTKVYSRKTVYSLPTPLAEYRLHEKGCVATIAAAVRGDGSEFFAAERKLRDWQWEFLHGVHAVDPLVLALLRDLRTAAHSRDANILGTLRMMIRGIAHRVSRATLPEAAYRAVLSVRQRESANRAWREHVRLCRRLAEARLQEAQARCPR
jgi:glycosyltransferase involved in cell wall biosynthesis